MTSGLRIPIVIDSRKFQSDLNRVRRGLRSITSAAVAATRKIAAIGTAGVGIGASFVAGTTLANRALKELDDAMRITGIQSASRIQAWDLALKTQGEELRELQNILIEIGVKAQEALEAPASDTAKAFRRAGIELVTMTGKIREPQQLLLDAFKHIEDYGTDISAIYRDIPKIVSESTANLLIGIVGAGDSIEDLERRMLEANSTISREQIQLGASAHRETIKLMHILETNTTRFFARFTEDFNDVVDVLTNETIPKIGKALGVEGDKFTDLWDKQDVRDFTAEVVLLGGEIKRWIEIVAVYLNNLILAPLLATINTLRLRSLATHEETQAAAEAAVERATPFTPEELAELQRKTGTGPVMRNRSGQVVRQGGRGGPGANEIIQKGLDINDTNVVKGVVGTVALAAGTIVPLALGARTVYALWTGHKWIRYTTYTAAAVAASAYVSADASAAEAEPPTIADPALLAIAQDAANEQRIREERAQQQAAAIAAAGDGSDFDTKAAAITGAIAGGGDVLRRAIPVEANNPAATTVRGFGSGASRGAGGLFAFEAMQLLDDADISPETKAAVAAALYTWSTNRLGQSEGDFKSALEALRQTPEYKKYVESQKDVTMFRKEYQRTGDPKHLKAYQDALEKHRAHATEYKIQASGGGTNVDSAGKPIDTDVRKHGNRIGRARLGRAATVGVAADAAQDYLHEIIGLDGIKRFTRVFGDALAGELDESLYIIPQIETGLIHLRHAVERARDEKLAAELRRKPEQHPSVPVAIPGIDEWDFAARYRARRERPHKPNQFLAAPERDKDGRESGLSIGHDTVLSFYNQGRDAWESPFAENVTNHPSVIESLKNDEGLKHAQEMTKAFQDMEAAGVQSVDEIAKNVATLPKAMQKPIADSITTVQEYSNVWSALGPQVQATVTDINRYLVAAGKEQSKEAEALFYVQQAIHLANAIVSVHAGAAAALSIPYVGPAISAAILGLGAVQIAAIIGTTIHGPQFNRSPGGAGGGIGNANSVWVPTQGELRGDGVPHKSQLEATVKIQVEGVGNNTSVGMTDEQAELIGVTAGQQINQMIDNRVAQHVTSDYGMLDRYRGA